MCEISKLKELKQQNAKTLFFLLHIEHSCVFVSPSPNICIGVYLISNLFSNLLLLFCLIKHVGLSFFIKSLHLYFCDVSAFVVFPQAFSSDPYSGLGLKGPLKFQPTPRFAGVLELCPNHLVLHRFAEFFADLPFLDPQASAAFVLEKKPMFQNKVKRDGNFGILGDERLTRFRLYR